MGVIKNRIGGRDLFEKTVTSTVAYRANKKDRILKILSYELCIGLV